jgi:GT2 family glycosyltransferase
MAPPSLSIIIVNFNTFTITCQCIASIYAKTRLDLEIILIDNGSHECDASQFSKIFPNIKLLVLPSNVGFARANNAGIKMAQGRVFLLLNSDTIVFDNAIERTLAYLNGLDYVGLIGCKLLNKDGSEQLSSLVPTRYPLVNLFVNGNPILNFLNKRFDLMVKFNYEKITARMQAHNHICEAVSGAFMMVKKEVVDSCGAFDPDFFMYSEETEWCRNRIIKKKFSVMYFSEASIIHLGGSSSSSFSKTGQALLSSFLYNYKLGNRNYVASILIYILNTITALLVMPFISSANRKRELDHARAFINIIPSLFFNIPKYGRRLGSRPLPLKYED